MDFTIRQESQEDYQAVYALNALAFGQSKEAILVDKLRIGEAFVPELSLVATSHEKVVGHILFTKIHITPHNLVSLALAPMAVLPTYQRQGIGEELIRHGLQKAKELNFSSIIVLGHVDYYPKFGFLPAEKWGIRAPFEVPSEAFMALELAKGGLSNAAGVVKYPIEFEDV
jgi:putative acetyltransferase